MCNAILTVVFISDFFHLCVQLDKAQTQQGRWQSLGNTNPDKKRLGADVEDECKSIAWQVRLLKSNNTQLAMRTPVGSRMTSLGHRML